MNYDIVIVGGGPAGLAAAIEAKKNDVDSILVLERDRELGGILQQCIHNGFGLHEFKKELTGPEYAHRFIEQLKELNIEYMLDTMVLEIDKSKTIHALNSNQGLMKIQAKSIVLAMGCRERSRGAINIPGYRPSGVFTAGSAQRFINMEGYMVGKKVIILGSGDIGLIMARRMTLEGAKVLAVVELQPFSGGLMRNIVQCLEDYNIPLLLNHTVTKIEGKDRLSGVVVQKVDDNKRPIKGSEIHYDCDTLLLSVGLIPENELSSKAGIEMDNITRGVIVNESMETSISGIFACGNVVHVHDLVDYVTEESRKAGTGAAKYVKGVLIKDDKTINIKGTNGIRYVVPQHIRISNINKSLDLLMRVDNVYKNVELVIKEEVKVIKIVKRKNLAPGEMLRIQLTLQDIQSLEGQTITVEIHKKEQKNNSTVKEKLA